jgi:hypothetical protein
MERREVDEVIVPAEPPAAPSDVADGAQSSAAANPSVAPDLRVASDVPPVVRSSDPLLGDYVSFTGQAGPDPRTVNLNAVTDGLRRIIEVEGPMIAKRAYDIYLRGCGIRRLGPDLKSTMNKALHSLVHQGLVISENEPGISGLLFSTVRSKASLPVRLRCRGPRAFDEIPPAELRAAGKHLSETHQLTPGSDEHLRAILEYFDLKRLTAQVGTRLLEIIDEGRTDSATLFDRTA